MIRITSYGRTNGRNFFSRLITAEAIYKGKKVLIASNDKKNALSEISKLKELFGFQNLKVEHQYRKDTIYVYQNELSENPIIGVKTFRKYSGALVSLQ